MANQCGLSHLTIHTTGHSTSACFSTAVSLDGNQFPALETNTLLTCIQVSTKMREEPESPARYVRDIRPHLRVSVEWVEDRQHPRTGSFLQVRSPLALCLQRRLVDDGHSSWYDGVPILWLSATIHPRGFSVSR